MFVVYIIMHLGDVFATLYMLQNYANFDICFSPSANGVASG